MSFIIDNEIKDRVRTGVDIVELISSYTDLRRQGRAFVARCPWHDDQRPSLQVNPQRQVWKCWVCDLGGDVFSWVMQKEGITFPEALKMLAERAGITLEPMDRARLSNASGKGADDKKLLYDAMQWATLKYHEHLKHAADGEAARKYLAERGLSQEMLDAFRVGFAPDGWTWLIDQAIPAGITTKTLESVNAVVKSERGTYYDRFRGRILFPIRDPQGRPIALGGRIVPGYSSDREQAKYINSTETRLYSKSHQLYGLDRARDSIGKRKQAVVVEGYTDVIMAHQHGITNAVAVCGTALGESHIKLLRRYCDSVLLLLDGDEAGQRRTNEILELFMTAQMDLQVLTLPDGLDPCDFLLQRGGPALEALMETATDALEHKVQVTCRGFNPLVDTHRANAALEEILSTMAKAWQAKTSSNDATQLRHEQILGRLARQFGVTVEQLRGRLLRIRDEQKSRQRVAVTAPQAEATAKPVVPFRFADLTPYDRELYCILVQHPELAPMALERFPESSLGCEAARALLRLYMELELAGQSLEFGSLMSAMEDVALKSIFVSLEEEAAQKSPLALLDAQQRLHTLCERLSKQDQRNEDLQRLRILESKQLDEKEELALLEELIEQARLRQGLVPPKG